MKKIIGFFIIITLYLFLLFNIDSKGLVDIDLLNNNISTDKDNNFYVLSEGKEKSSIYKIDENSHTKLAVSINKYTNNYKKEIADIYANDQGIYYILKYTNRESGNFYKYEANVFLYEKNQVSELFSISDNVDVSEILVEDQKMYISTIKSSNIINIYKADLAQLKNPPEVISEYVFKDKEVVQSCFVSNTIYGLTKDGKVYKCIDNNAEDMTKDLNGFTYISGKGQSLLMYCQGNKTLYYDNIATGEIAKFEDNTTVNCAVGLDKKSIYILCSNPQGNTTIYNYYDGKLINKTEDIKDNINTAKSKLDEIIKITIIFIGTVAGIFLIVLMYKKSTRLTLKITIIAVVLCLILIGAVTTVSYKYNINTIERERNSLGAINNEIQLNLISEIDDKAIDPINFSTSKDYDNIKKIITNHNVNNNPDSINTKQYLVYNDGLHKYIIASGSNVVVGQLAETCFNEETIDIIEKSIKENYKTTNIVTENDKKYSITVAPLNTNIVPSIVLVTTVTMTDMIAAEKDTLSNLVVLALAVSLITIAVLIIVIRLALYPIKKLSKTMSYVAAGNYDYKKMSIPNHEIGNMWIALRKMCNGLKNKNYLNENILNSYYRFVPRKLEKLLEKETIIDVNTGDSKYINGTLEIVSVIEKEEIYKNINNIDYVRYVNDCFGIISKNTNENDGILLSNDFNLSSIKVMYPDSVESAVISAIVTLKELNKKKDDSVIIVHSTPFLYGIAGNNEQAFPFITSPDVEVLSQFTNNFRKAGVKLVITDATLKKLRGRYNTRYIGYISADDKKYSYKLYEILDVFTEYEQIEKTSSDKNFQDGIQLFYKNDFYLARNKFSSVVKDCPKDGIARWYLFACESMLNSSDFDNPEYNLFGINID